MGDFSSLGVGANTDDDVAAAAAAATPVTGGGGEAPTAATPTSCVHAAFTCASAPSSTTPSVANWLSAASWEKALWTNVVSHHIDG